MPVLRSRQNRPPPPPTSSVAQRTSNSSESILNDSEELSSPLQGNVLHSAGKQNNRSTVQSIVLGDKGFEEEFFGFTKESEGDVYATIDAVPAKLSQTDSRFAGYVERMRLTDRRFLVPVSGKELGRLGRVLEAVGRDSKLLPLNGTEMTVDYVDVENDFKIPTSLSPGDAAQKKKERILGNRLWLFLVSQEFLRRRRQFERTVGNGVGGKLKIFVPILTVVLLLVYWRWPFWNVLFDVETNNNFKVLEVSPTATTMEIKKSYRQLTKKWHPDLNPSCGALCRNKMMQIQRAYDELLKLKRDHVEEANEREKQYRQLLAEIVGFILYRGYDMAMQTILVAAFWWERLVKALFRGKPARSRYLFQLSLPILKVTGMLIFLACTFLYVTGLNLMLVLMSFARVVLLFRNDAYHQFTTARHAMKVSHLDTGKALVFFGIPTILAHIVYFTFYDPYPQSDLFVFQLFYGTFFFVGHLAATAPNLWDNIRMMHCAVPPKYCAGRADGGIRFSLWSMLWAEFGFLLDDLFAFATGIPAFYRIAAILLHVCFLVEFKVLPWELPVSNDRIRRRRKHKSQEKRQVENQPDSETKPSSDSTDNSLLSPMLHAGQVGERGAPAGADGSDDSSSEDETNGKEPSTATENKVVTLTPEEVKIVTKLDYMPISWLQTVQLYCPGRVFQAVEALKVRRNVEATAIRSGRVPPQLPPSGIQVKRDNLPPHVAEILDLDEDLFIPKEYLPPPRPKEHYLDVYRRRTQERLHIAEGALNINWSSSMVTRVGFFAAVLLLALLGSSPGETLPIKQPLAPYLPPQHGLNLGHGTLQTAELLPGPFVSHLTVPALVPEAMEAIRAQYINEAWKSAHTQGGTEDARGQQQQQSQRGKQKRK